MRRDRNSSNNPLHPSYYHSFLTTEDYIIFIDQAFCISMKTFVKNQLLGKTLATTMRYKPKYKNHFVVIEKKTGRIIPKKYVSEPFFFFHTINAYEENGHIICDICCFDDGQAWQDIFGEKQIDIISKTQSGSLAETMYAQGLKSKAKRFILPLDTRGKGNLVRLDSSSATAFAAKNRIVLTPEILTPESIKFIEMPQIHYVKCNGRKYRYFYGITRNEQYITQLAKVDVLTKTAKVLIDKECNFLEPIFVPHPDASSEDDGIVLSVALSEKEENKGSLVFLDGKSFQEIARAEFTAPSAMVNEFHGIFLGANNKPFST
ncbi:carotenoid-cleaving dioxygenase, mitochondrial-like [Brevipalpus obovatus]|uniref:carotenoid-cleaving dioxygenase, mitochondrial-like n=1 Tax=Brevipalpus obovatus TaxID=246614 RepID=UPI003D9DCA56